MEPGHRATTFVMSMSASHMIWAFIVCTFLRCPNHDVSAVDGSDYIGETGQRCKAPFGVGLLLHSVREPDVPIIHPDEAIHTAGIMALSDGCDIPDLEDR